MLDLFLQQFFYKIPVANFFDCFFATTFLLQKIFDFLLQPFPVAKSFWFFLQQILCCNFFLIFFCNSFFKKKMVADFFYFFFATEPNTFSKTLFQHSPSGFCFLNCAAYPPDFLSLTSFCLSPDFLFSAPTFSICQSRRQRNNLFFVQKVVKGCTTQAERSPQQGFRP